MLPLWIIDITSSETKRSEKFLSLLSQIEHVYIDEDIRLPHGGEGDVKVPHLYGESDIISDEKKKGDAEELLSVTNVTSVTSMETSSGRDGVEVGGESPRDGVASLQEWQDIEAKQLAAKNAVIRGDYWYYSRFKDCFAGVNTDKEENIGKTAERLYKFQEDMVSEGKKFIRRLRESNVRPYQTMNVVILGDSTEDFSRSVFPSIAAILQKEKGRILPAHIHQGMCIFGALYVPCNANTLNVRERSKILRMLQEIEVQHNLTEIRGYDHMMLWQNVQNRTQCTYSLLSEEQQAEYLMQCLIHLFFACDQHHPLISGTSSDDTFYFSMGATSLYFDTSLEDLNDVNTVAHYVVQNFKESGECREATPSCIPSTPSRPYGDRQEYRLFDMTNYRAESFVGAFADISRLDIENYEPERPSPHPISDFMKKKLKKQYYGNYLRFFPATLLSRIIRKVEENTSSLLDRVNAHCQSAYRAAEMSIQPAITRIIQKVTDQDGAIETIDNEIRQMQEDMSTEKSRIRDVLEQNFWEKITDSASIPENQRQHFEEYHDAYKADIAAKNGGSGCEQMKREATQKLKRLLSREKTMMSTMVRCFLLGIILVLSVLPCLSMLSPRFVNLGDVRGNAMLWSFGLFMLPVTLELLCMWLYLRKKAVLMRILRAYYTHDAYARIANRIETEAGNFYSRMIDLGEEYLKRSKRIRTDVNVVVQRMEIKNPFPETMFNQPFNGGQRESDWNSGEKKQGAAEGKILVNHQPRIIQELDKTMYYLLINHLKDELAILYKDVRVSEDHARRLNEQTGEYEFVGREELLQEREAEWQEDRKLFYSELKKSISALMVPREATTVGEMINLYKRKTDDRRLLEPMIAYAATNGEITSDADTEYADVKVNVIDEQVLGTLPIYNTRVQTDKYSELYQKLIFVTRWRCFDHFAFNRILPTEDFDQSVREIRIYEEEEKKRRRKRAMRRDGVASLQADEEQQSPYVLHISSLILWSVCPDDNSPEWLRLFEAEYFSRAFTDREKLRKVLNQED